jgi:hypothetical protein
MSTSTRSTTSRSVQTAAEQARPARPPLTAIAAVGLQLLFAAVTSFGVFYFSLVDAAKPPLAAGLALVALYWSVNVIGVAGSIGLLRGRALGRRILVAYAVYEILFSLAKILIWHETPAYLFGALSIVLIALVTAPATRRYAS